jgi:hypothetical protein
MKYPSEQAVQLVKPASETKQLLHPAGHVMHLLFLIITPIEELRNREHTWRADCAGVRVGALSALFGALLAGVELIHETCNMKWDERGSTIHIGT